MAVVLRKSAMSVTSGGGSKTIRQGVPRLYNRLPAPSIVWIRACRNTGTTRAVIIPDRSGDQMHMTVAQGLQRKMSAAVRSPLEGHDGIRRLRVETVEKGAPTRARL